MKKDRREKKRGSSLLEVAVVIGITVIVVGIMGPIIRYYLRLGQRFSYGISLRAELDGSYQRLEQIIQSATINDKWGNLTSGTKNAGIAVVNDNCSPTISEKLLTFQGNILSSNGQSRRKGNILYVMTPVYTDNGTSSTMLEVYNTFRFWTVNGNTGLYYSSSTDSATGMPLTITDKQDIVPLNPESLMLPTGVVIQKLVPNIQQCSGNQDNTILHNYFIEVGGGVLMHLEYYIDPTKTVATELNAPSNIAIVEKMFLKRGEV